MSILQYFLPNDRKFFPLFDQAATNLQEAGKVMYKLVTARNHDERIQLIRQIEDLEHRGDEITHEVFKELSTNFITPFDREDIHRLVSAIDDILDYINGSSKRIELYKLKECTSDMVKLSELLQTQTEELMRLIHELKNKRNLRNITESLVLINSIENHADDIFEVAIANLFDDQTNAIEIIKTKEILSTLETATDRCEDAAHIMETVIVKLA